MRVYMKQNNETKEAKLSTWHWHPSNFLRQILQSFKMRFPCLSDQSCQEHSIKPLMPKEMLLLTVAFCKAGLCDTSAWERTGLLSPAYTCQPYFVTSPMLAQPPSPRFSQQLQRSNCIIVLDESLKTSQLQWHEEKMTFDLVQHLYQIWLHFLKVFKRTGCRYGWNTWKHNESTHGLCQRYTYTSYYSKQTNTIMSAGMVFGMLPLAQSLQIA